MAPLFGGGDDMRKISENMQNLSEQIGALQQQLLAKTKEADGLRTQAAQAIGSSVALEDANAQIEVLRNQLAELQKQNQSGADDAALQQAHAQIAALQQQVTTLQALQAAPAAAAPAAPAAAAGLAAGATAWVTRAGGLPLRLRSGPSLDADVIDRLQPGTQLTLMEGPVAAGGTAGGASMRPTAARAGSPAISWCCSPIRAVGAMTESLGVGVVCLHEGRTMLVALDRTTRCHAVAGCDLRAEKIAAARAARPDLFYTTSYDELLARPDVRIVSIFTPDALHAEHVVRAFEAGKDVTCTKPLVPSIADARRVIEAARRTGRRLLVGQSTRFFESFQRQRTAYEHGEIGQIELVDAHYIHRMDWFYKKSPWAASESDWIFLGMSHPIDLVRWYLGRIEE
ncbi:MAG TPA: Gfo/Idh/MocA family oxidoreductase, partial [Roseiflexaceae bacterium]